jgi:hypothetical protein
MGAIDPRYPPPPTWVRRGGSARLEPLRHRDAAMILIGYRHGPRASELCDLQ